MNLLDQLFQYSLKSESCSISFSALPSEQTLNLSSIHNVSLSQSQRHSPSKTLLYGNKKESTLTNNKTNLQKAQPFNPMLAKRRAMDPIYLVLGKAYKINRQILTKQAFRRIKQIIMPHLKLDKPKQINIFVNCPYFIIETPLLANHNNKEHVNNKIAYLHPHRKQVQNPNLCDTMNIFVNNNFDGKSSYTSTAYGSHQKEASQVLQTSFIDLSENKFKTSNQSSSRKKPSISHFTVSSHVEDTEAHLGAFAQHQEQEGLPNFARTCQDRMYYNKQGIKQFQENQRLQHQTGRLSSKSIEDESNIYFKMRSLEKQITLKQIQNSKQTIKKVVYQLQRSKSKRSKQKIKLNGRKASHEKKGYQIESSFTSPIRPKSVQNKTERASSVKQEDTTQRCIYTIQQIQQQKDTTNSVEQGLNEFQSISKNLQMYYNYMKAKQFNKKIESAKKGQAFKHKTNQQNTTARREDSKNQETTSMNPVLTIKEGTKRSRKIDLKVDLGRPQKNITTKLVGKKNK